MSNQGLLRSKQTGIQREKLPTRASQHRTNWWFPADKC